MGWARHDNSLRGALLAIAAAGVLMAAGCGGDDDDTNNADRYEGEEREVASLVDALAEAGRDGDGERICEEVFARALAVNIERQAQQSCTSEVIENIPDDYDLEVRQIAIAGNRATASVREPNDNEFPIRFIRQQGEWRVISIPPRN